MSTPNWFNPTVSFGNVLTMIGMFVAGIFAFNDVKSDIRVNNVQIQNNRDYARSGLQTERQLTNDAIMDLKAQAAQDRAEMKRQFDKLNDKLDKLIEDKHGK